MSDEELWTDDEVEAAAQAYVSMLEFQEQGRAYSKADISRSYRDGPLSARSKQSFDYRMRNISAVFAEMGRTLVQGYVPAEHVGEPSRKRIREALARVEAGSAPIRRTDASKIPVTPQGAGTTVVNVAHSERDDVVSAPPQPGVRSKVFIANFGQENYLWPKCREHSTIAIHDHVRLYPLWVAQDRTRYIDEAVAHVKTVRGETPTRPVASRWYSLNEVLSQTAGDIWVHRQRDELWWTESLSDQLEVSLQPSANVAREGPEIYELDKPTKPWSDKTRKGAQLSWGGLHPKARDFLSTEGTLQELSDEYADYALALVNGDDLAPWHDLPAWREKVGRTGKHVAVSFDARQRAIWRMAETVKQTVAQANGQQVLRALKSKLCAFTDEELKGYIDHLITDQDGVCALTGLVLQYDGDADDKALLCSLDRIDSDGHYEPGNLQVVCRFANFWKSESRDAEFRRLLSLVRTVTP